jgi:homoserine dehydrogenase
MTQKLAFIGFGGVGQGLVEILLERGEELSRKHGFDAEVVAISDIMKGSIYHPDGLDLERVLEIVRENRSLENYDQAGLTVGWDSLKTIRETNADTIVEVTYTDVKTGQPAIDHCKAAFESGKNVVTTNKGPVALAYNDLSELADKHNVQWGFEGTVMSGTPALRMPLVSLTGNRISEIRGIFNGTTNFILTKMEEGIPYEDALAEAQRLGFAEADPTSDVEGYDARYKIVILSNAVLNRSLRIEEVNCTGISHLTLDNIQEAKNLGMKWKLLARVHVKDDKLTASVRPEKVPLTDPLASISGCTNAITFECDLSGPITLVGAGAGRIETGYSLLIDLLNFERFPSQAKHEVKK